MHRISQRVHCLINPSLRCHRATELLWPHVTSAPKLGAGMSRTVLGPSFMHERGGRAIRGVRSGRTSLRLKSTSQPSPNLSPAANFDLYQSKFVPLTSPKPNLVPPMHSALSFHHSPCVGAVHPSLTHHACAGVPNGPHSGCKAMGAWYQYLGRCRAHALALVVVLVVVIL